MGKKILRENIRVEVTPDTWPYHEEEKRQQREIAECENIVQQIKRHVDGFSSVGVFWDRKEVCEYCGYDWEVMEEDDFTDSKYPMYKGMPLCCGKAQDEFLAERKVDH